MILTLALTTLVPQFDQPFELSDNPGAASAIATGDFDGDGLDDVVASIGSVERLVLFRSAGGGTFHRSVTVAPALADFTSLAMADLDGDGDGDIVAIDEASGRVFAYVNSGGVTLASAIQVADFGTAVDRDARFEVVSDDATGDDVLDIVVSVNDNAANPANGVWVVETLVSPSGTSFAPATRLWASPRAASAPQLVDLDGDGDRDLLLIDTLARTVRWARKDSSITLVTTATLTPAINGLASAVAGELDGDSIVDVVATSSDQAAKLQIMRGLGGGAFAPMADFQSFTNAVRRRQQLQLADFDSDGDLDLLEEFTDATNLSSLAWFRLDGPADPAPRATFMGRADAARLASCVADVNGDGYPDVVSGLAGVGQAGEAAIGWYENLGGPSTTFGNQFSGRQAVTLSADNRIAARDFDGDGFTDLLIAWRFGTGAVRIARGQRGGTFALPEVTAFDHDLTYGEQLAMDFDGDGDLDLLNPVYANVGPFPFINDASWMINDGTGAFARGQSFGQVGGALVRFIDAIDYDSDGREDVLAVVNGLFRMHVRDAHGAFMTGAGFILPGLAWVDHDSVVLGDFDGDGLEDVLYSRSTTQSSPRTLRLMVKSPGVGFEPEVEYAAIVSPGALRVGDLDGDGDLDAIADRASDGATWLRNDATGPTFTELPLVPGLIGSSETQSVQTGDLTGDGMLDLIRFGSEPVSPTDSIVTGFVAEGLGSGTFGAFIEVVSRESSSLDSTRPLLSDLDGDGDLDFLTIWSDKRIFIYPGTALRVVGISECGPAVPNFTGFPGEIQAVGTEVAHADNLTLQASSLLPNTLGIFLASQTAVVSTVPNSIGRLCLGGSIGRFLGPSDTIITGPAGFMEQRVPLTAIPNGAGQVLAVPGQTWRFQAWTRDIDPVTQTPTSNFTDTIAVTLR